MEEKITYFEKVGRENTGPTLKLALERAKARGIKKVVMASTLGDTARLAAQEWKNEGIKLIVVPHQANFMGLNFDPEIRKELEKAGHVVHLGTMLFHTDAFYGTQAPTIMANILRTFSQGMKVVVEILLMVTDGGHVDTGEQVVVVTGSGRGADTAVVAVAATSSHIYDFHITEIICKPLQTKNMPPPPPGSAPPSYKKP
jgi:hypothetical protein